MSGSHALSAPVSVALGSEANERARRAVQIVLCSLALALTGIAGTAMARFVAGSSSTSRTSFLVPTQTVVTPGDLARERR
jgi:hypothetical protein